MSDGDDSVETPDRELFEDDPVGHATVAGGMTVGELVDQYGDAGIGAASVHEAADVTSEMLGDDDCTVFLSLAGAMVPTGMRRVVADLIRDGYVDALVTTGANLTHDAIEAIGGKHHHGEEGPGHAAQYDHGGHGHGDDGHDNDRHDHGDGDDGHDNDGHDHGDGDDGHDNDGHDHGDSGHGHDNDGHDHGDSGHGHDNDRHDHGDGDDGHDNDRHGYDDSAALASNAGDDSETLRDHDEQLRDEQVDRIYNVYLPQEHFALLESHLREEVFPPLAEEGVVSISRLCAELGRANAAVNEREEIDEGPGVVAAAYENDVPIYCPAVQDSVLGLQAWMYTQTSDLQLDATADMTPLTNLAFDADDAGCLLVGGGVPKNFTLQTMLVTPRAYDYAVQITMDPEATGGLSGATLDEARSWGKLEEDARNASVYGDATVFLPLLVTAARERIE